MKWTTNSGTQVEVSHSQDPSGKWIKTTVEKPIGDGARVTAQDASGKTVNVTKYDKNNHPWTEDNSGTHDARKKK